MNIRKITEAANQVSELNDINVTEAVSLKDMGFKKWDYIVPSFRIGRLEGVSADQLTKLFGPPKKGSGDGKSTMEWGFQNKQGLIFTVYDYRNPPASKSAPHNWSVGGVNKGHATSVQRAFKMMGVPGKMIKEEIDPFMVGQTVSEWRDADTGDVMEGVRVMSGAEGMIKNDPAGGASMVSSFRKSKAALASKPAGSVLLLTKEKDPESMALKIYEPKDFDSLMRGLSKKPEKKVGSKGSWSDGEVTVIALKEETLTEIKYPGEVKRLHLHEKEYVVLYSGNRFRTYRMGEGNTRFPDGRRGDQIGLPQSYMTNAVEAAEKDAGIKEEVEIEENYKDTLKGVRNIKVVKPVDFAKNLTVGSTWTLMYDTSYMGDPMYRLYNSNAPSGKKMSGRISGKKIAKALEAGMLVKEGVEVEGEDLQEDKIRYKRILTGVKTLSDSQAPFTVVVISPSDKVIMQKSVKGKNVLPATINTMISSDLKGKSWKAISIEGSRKGYGRTGGVLNVLYPKDVMKESMEEMDEGFAQPTNDELRKSIKWLEGLMKDPAKMKKAGLDISDVKDNLRAAKDFLAFGDNVRKSMKKAGVKEGIEEETEEISESVAAVVGGALSTLLAGGFSFVALNFLFDNAFTPSEIKREWAIFMRRWKDKSAGGKMSGDQGAAMAKEMRALIAKLPKKNQSYLSGIVTRMQNSLKPNKDGKVDKEAAGKFLRAAKEKIAKTKTEGVEVDEASWGGGFQSSREAQAGVQASAKADAKRERTVLFSSIRAVMMGKMSKAEFKKKIGQSFEKISPLAKQKAMKQKGIKESVEIDENTYTTHLGTQVTHIDYGQMAQEQAKKILAKAKELGVKVMVQSSTSVAFVKEFTKGNRDAYFKAYRDCDTIRSMVKFTKRQNEWGCQGIGMLDCMEKGKIMIYKSGDGAAKLLDILYKSFRG